MISSPFASTLLAISFAGVAAAVRTAAAAAVDRACRLGWMEAGRAASGATSEKVSARTSNNRFTFTPYLIWRRRFKFLHQSLRICTTNLSQRTYGRRHRVVAWFYASGCLWVFGF